MQRRTFLALTPALLMPRMALAADRVFYEPGNAEAEMKAGKVVRTSQFNTHYIPEDKVTCTNP